MSMMTSKYYVGAYYDEAFRGLAYAKGIDDWNEVEEFIWEYAQKGFNCLIIEHQTGTKQYAFAEDFNENTVEPQEIIRDTKKNWRESLCTNGNH